MDNYKHNSEYWMMRIIEMMKNPDDNPLKVAEEIRDVIKEIKKNE